MAFLPPRDIIQPNCRIRTSTDMGFEHLLKGSEDYYFRTKVPSDSKLLGEATNLSPSTVGEVSFAQTLPSGARRRNKNRLAPEGSGEPSLTVIGRRIPPFHPQIRDGSTNLGAASLARLDTPRSLPRKARTEPPNGCISQVSSRARMRQTKPSSNIYQHRAICERDDVQQDSSKKITQRSLCGEERGERSSTRTLPLISVEPPSLCVRRVHRPLITVPSR